MSNLPAPRALPEKPNLRHLKDQAKDLVKSGTSASIAEAQFRVARSYGFPSWPKLKLHVEAFQKTGALKRAIDHDDVATVKDLMTAHPALHQAPLGYGKNGPLTWVAECRGLGVPTRARLEMAQWMIDHGSDVHQGGDGPLMRAALNEQRILMMELLVRNGADVNAEWDGTYPILYAPCESMNPAGLRWLLEHGAHPDCPKPGRTTTALDYLLGSYVRSNELTTCVNLLRAAGGTTRYGAPGVLETATGRRDQLSALIDDDPGLLHRRFPELDFGSTGARRLLLTNATLLHVAAEFSSLECAALLMDRGALVNAPAGKDDTGTGAQTAIFHAVSQFGDRGLQMTKLLVERGADLRIRAQLPGHYERLDEFVECTPLGYALQFPGSEFPGSNQGTIRLLMASGGVE